MSLSVPISPQDEERLARFARSAGVTPDVFAARLLQRSLSKLQDVAELSGPIGEDFARSGLTEDQLSEFLEIEKHDMRAQRRRDGSRHHGRDVTS